MFGKWYQIYVKGKSADANSPQMMKRVDNTLTSRFPAFFVELDGLPVLQPDGTFEVRCLLEADLSMIKRVLTDHHGLEIVSILENE